MSEKKFAPTRRQVVASLAGVGAAAIAPKPTFAQQTKVGGATFVLVHGANNGGYVWKYVAPRLRAMGHTVYTPTLTGLGERSHLMSKDVTLETHIMDVVNLIKWEDLTNVTLVSHSYGGWPGSGVPEKVGDALGSVVFLDAFMPDNGQKGVDLNSPKSREDVLKAIKNGEVSRPPRESEIGPMMKPEDRAWLDSKATPQPIGVSMQPIVLTGARDRVAKRTYIRARGYPNPNFDAAYNACKAKGWNVFEVPCGHSVMVEMPDRLIEILTSVAAT
ncbi:MAG TPA: alpha/beta hydrolase [Alphaproteobacteria bacterium]|jgi:pimeloyl-ACP methyl ester carboxylesterase|nr:alpha/beta hydrolase [Alphaproteobacteria bacterium]